ADLEHAAALGGRKRAAARYACLPGRSLAVARRVAAQYGAGPDAAERNPISKPHPRRIGSLSRDTGSAQCAFAPHREIAGGTGREPRSRHLAACDPAQGLESHPTHLSIEGI